jgi:hypothetical protein
VGAESPGLQIFGRSARGKATHPALEPLRAGLGRLSAESPMLEKLNSLWRVQTLVDE